MSLQKSLNHRPLNNSALIMQQLSEGQQGNLGHRLHYVVQTLCELGHQQLIFIGTDDLQTNACCIDDVMTRYYGCGLVTPELLNGCHVLDLGCGAGRDRYAIGQMVGENGFVTGVDMADEQLAVANQHSEYHREKFGYAKANTKFLKGYIEKLDELNIADNSIDVVVSNCVINLSPDKYAVLKEIFRMLKPSGEIYFSDVYAEKRVPANLVDDPPKLAKHAKSDDEALSRYRNVREQIKSWITTLPKQLSTNQA